MFDVKSHKNIKAVLKTTNFALGVEFEIFTVEPKSCDWITPRLKDGMPE